MDKLSRFGSGVDVTKVTLTSDENTTLDDVTAELRGILTQLQATHLGHEEEDWGKSVGLDEAFEEDDGEDEFIEDR